MTDSATQAMPWSTWALSNLQQGVLVLDAQSRVVFANRWLLQRAGLPEAGVLGRSVLDVFALHGSYFSRVLHQAMTTGFPAMLSHSLHPHPLPLHAIGAQNLAGARPLLRQSVHVVPMGPADAAQAGQRYTLVQVVDVTVNMRREGVLKAKAGKLHEMARIDTLTGIGNRRSFDEALETELRAGARSSTPFGLLLLDLDYFKLYNDHYGHVAGDHCLQTVADLLRRVCRRPRDMAARYGGEELAAVLPGADLQGAVRVGREVVEGLRDLKLPHAANPNGGIVTVSVGVSCSQFHTVDTAQHLIDMADQALYAAKSAGRNRVCFYDPSTQTVSAGE